MINPDKVESRLSSKIFRTLTLYMLIVLCTFFGYVMLFKDVRDTSKPGSGTAVTSPFTALINSLMATETMETDLNFSVAGADLQLQMAGDIKLDIQNQDFSANLDLVYNDSFYTISAYKNSNLQESNTIFVSVNDESYKMDLRDENCVKQTFDKVFKRFDYVDAVVCNAGTADKEMLFADVPQKNIDNLLNTNLRGTIICNQEAFRRFLKQKHGNIVNISSIFGINGGPCEAAYSATKGGIIALTKALAVEGAPFKIRVNAVAPGYIDTKMTAHFSEKEKEHAISMTPLARIGQGQDVAEAVFFLANDSSSFVTGEILTVSGGVLRF